VLCYFVFFTMFYVMQCIFAPARQIYLCANKVYLNLNLTNNTVRASKSSKLFCFTGTEKKYSKKMYIFKYLLVSQWSEFRLFFTYLKVVVIIIWEHPTSRLTLYCAYIYAKKKKKRFIICPITGQVWEHSHLDGHWLIMCEKKQMCERLEHGSQECGLF